jgi:hypothetical protein
VKPTATTSPTTSATSSPTSSPTSTIDPKAQPAVDAYLAYVTASNNALRKPRGLGETFSPSADYSKYSFDPAKSSLSAVILQFSSQGLKMTGDPGKPRTQVQSLELGAKPYPLVVLSDCPTSPVRWHPTDECGGIPRMQTPARTFLLPFLQGSPRRPTRRWSGSSITKAIGASPRQRAT